MSNIYIIFPRSNSRIKHIEYYSQRYSVDLYILLKGILQYMRHMLFYYMVKNNIFFKIIYYFEKAKNKTHICILPQTTRRHNMNTQVQTYNVTIIKSFLHKGSNILMILRTKCIVSTIQIQTITVVLSLFLYQCQKHNIIFILYKDKIHLQVIISVEDSYSRSNPHPFSYTTKD